MKTDKTGGPAFPTVNKSYRDCNGTAVEIREYKTSDGMMIWDEYAKSGAAFAGNSCFSGNFYQNHPSALADFCAHFADAMIAEREKRFK